jgi:hypothetical protein
MSNCFFLDANLDWLAISYEESPKSKICLDCMPTPPMFLSFLFKFKLCLWQLLMLLPCKEGEEAALLSLYWI